MTKPENQSAAAQAFDRSTVREVLRRARACKKLDDAHAALRAAWSVIGESEIHEQETKAACASCGLPLMRKSGKRMHARDCKRLTAVALVREALGEKV